MGKIKGIPEFWCFSHGSAVPGIWEIFFSWKKWEKQLEKATGASGMKQLERKEKIPKNSPKILDFPQVLGCIPQRSKVWV